MDRSSPLDDLFSSMGYSDPEAPAVPDDTPEVAQAVTPAPVPQPVVEPSAGSPAVGPAPETPPAALEEVAISRAEAKRRFEARLGMEVVLEADYAPIRLVRKVHRIHADGIDFYTGMGTDTSNLPLKGSNCFARGESIIVRHEGDAQGLVYLLRAPTTEEREAYNVYISKKMAAKAAQDAVINAREAERAATAARRIPDLRTSFFAGKKITCDEFIEVAQTFAPGALAPRTIGSLRENLTQVSFAFTGETKTTIEISSSQVVQKTAAATNRLREIVQKSVGLVVGTIMQNDPSVCPAAAPAPVPGKVVAPAAGEPAKVADSVAAVAPSPEPAPAPAPEPIPDPVAVQEEVLPVEPSPSVEEMGRPSQDAPSQPGEASVQGRSAASLLGDPIPVPLSEILPLLETSPEMWSDGSRIITKDVISDLRTVQMLYEDRDPQVMVARSGFGSVGKASVTIHNAQGRQVEVSAPPRALEALVGIVKCHSESTLAGAEGRTPLLPARPEEESCEDPIFGKTIHAYTRAQALEDGYLVDLTEWASATKGFHGGFRVPVAVTKSVWEDIEAIPKSKAFQDVRGRAHDVLYMASLAAKRRPEWDGSALGFRLIMHVGKTAYQTYAIRGSLDEQGQQVITITKPGED